MTQTLEQLDNVAIKLKANVYFDGGVISHTITTPDKDRKTIGVIRPGRYHFTTDAPEQMDIISGTCQVKLAGENAFKTYIAGQTFGVPGKSAFDITVETGLTEYLCSFK
jgi:uncharacterized protein YaiE (UPF0345 family)